MTLVFNSFDGLTFQASGYEDAVDQMNRSSHQPCKTRQEYMRETARRAEIERAAVIATDTPERWFRSMLANHFIYLVGPDGRVVLQRVTCLTRRIEDVPPPSVSVAGVLHPVSDLRYLDLPFTPVVFCVLPMMKAAQAHRIDLVNVYTVN